MHLRRSGHELYGRAIQPAHPIHTWSSLHSDYSSDRKPNSDSFVFAHERMHSLSTTLRLLVSSHPCSPSWCPQAPSTRSAATAAISRMIGERWVRGSRFWTSLKPANTPWVLGRKCAPQNAIYTCTASRSGVHVTLFKCQHYIGDNVDYGLWQIGE